MFLTQSNMPTRGSQSQQQEGAGRAGAVGVPSRQGVGQADLGLSSSPSQEKEQMMER